MQEYGLDGRLFLVIELLSSWSKILSVSAGLNNTPFTVGVGLRPQGTPTVSRARGQSQFGRPHLANSWPNRCKERVGSKGCRKLTWVPHKVVSIHAFKLIWLLHHKVDVRTLRAWKSLTTGHCRAKDLIVSREAIST